MERILIKKVKENDILYNTNSTYYRDTERRQRTWDKIGKEMNLKPEEARSIWDKLRRCFINARNRRRIKENETGITIHPWKYERDMAFLWPFVERNRKAHDSKADGSSMSENGDGELPDLPEDAERDIMYENATNDSIDFVKAEHDDAQEFDSPGTSMSFYGKDDNNAPAMGTPRENKKRSCPQYDTYESEHHVKRQRVAAEKSVFEMDENDLFFLSMSQMTKTLPVLERAKVKLAISNAVFQALIAVNENVST